jgi:hypothetical protein
VPTPRRERGARPEEDHRPGRGYRGAGARHSASLLRATGPSPQGRRGGSREESQSRGTHSSPAVVISALPSRVQDLDGRSGCSKACQCTRGFEAPWTRLLDGAPPEISGWLWANEQDTSGAPERPRSCAPAATPCRAGRMGHGSNRKESGGAARQVRHGWTWFPRRTPKTPMADRTADSSFASVHRDEPSGTAIRRLF